MSNNFEVGSVVEGTVAKIKPFGAIVALDENTQGLVHISQIANSFVQNITDHINIGDKVKVKILSVDSENGKIALSMKEANPEAAKAQNRSFKPRGQKNNYEQRNSNNNQSNESNPANDFEDKIKEWLKQANERQANLNKRANKR